MTDFLNSLRGWIGLESTWFWGLLGLGGLIAWVGVRAFLEDGRLRRALSLAIPLAPVLLAAVWLALDWPHVRRSITFTRPGYLMLLGLLPLVIAISMRSLSGLGPVRQTLAILVRSVILALLIAALAEAQFVRITDRLTVLFAIDYSRSMPQQDEQWTRGYVDTLIQKHKPPGDLAGVIYFAKSPRIEIPPLPYIELREPEGEYDRYHSDIAAALKLAQAAFPEDTMKRIVLVTDGNENRGDAFQQAVAARANGISIDTIPIRYRYDDEVMVEKVSMPPDVHQGETVNLNIIVRASRPIAGTLRLFQKSDNRTTPLVEKHLQLQRGVNPFSVPQKIDEPNSYDFRAIFDPDDLAEDRIPQNNEAWTLTYVRGSARVLLIEGTPGEHDLLVQALRQENIEVEQVGPDRVPNSLAELRPYDSVLLANLPREHLGDRQMEMLASNTHDLGAGLIMIGGPESFGAGGFIDSPIEKAMPVDMQIKNTKVTGKGALVLIMHACEIPQGNHWEKVIAKDAIKTLSYNDEAGVIQSQGGVNWVFTLQQVKNKTHLFGRIDRMTPQDMMDFDPVLVEARNKLMRSDAMTKHVILVTDGDPAAPTPSVVKSFVNAKITVTTVGVGVHGNQPMLQQVLQNLAKATGGRFHNVTNNNALPRIFQKEARVVSRPLIFEKGDAWTPNIVLPSEPIAGLSGVQLPPILGIVLTTPKQNELVEVPITSPLPAGTENPVLAHWVYGLGKSVAFTSDAGQKWTTAWTGWENYRKFWSQLVRWSMRSVEQGNVAISTHREGGKIRVIADVLDKENQFVNFAQIQGFVVDPEMQRRKLELTQVAPGRYEGVIDDAETQGAYFVNLAAQVPGSAPTLVTTGVSVPYPAEFRELESNPGLVEQIASITGGRVTEVRDAMLFDRDSNPFRHDLAPLTAAQDLWHVLLFTAVLLFLFDVAVRRIALDLTRVRPAMAVAWAYVRGREAEAAPVDYMTKLRSRKAEVSRELDQARSTRRFEPTPDTPGAGPGTGVIDEAPAAASARASRPVAKPGVTPEAPATQETYTSRLLKAKQKVWQEKKL